MLLPNNSWIPSKPDVVNAPGDRSADKYLKVVGQFAVTVTPRYKPGHAGGSETYCNIFLWDVTSALRCEIPHWVAADGAPASMGKPNTELSANGVCDWLKSHGAAYGWNPVSRDDAAARAKTGFPTVAVWKHTGGIGHVAMVIPGSHPVTIAQAGATNYESAPIEYGFGKLVVEFYTHE